MIILAIDPGISGALAFYLHSPLGVSGLTAVYDMPLLDGDVDPRGIRDVIMQHKPALAVIERVHSHPNEGVSSVWRFACAFATALAVLALAEIPIIQVPPAKWKKAMGIRGGQLGKEHARRLAIEMFPTQQESFKRVKDHGRAEATLIAVYASRLNEMRNYERQIEPPVGADHS